MLQTNRDFYLAIGELCRTRKDDARTLETYLLALLKLGEGGAASGGLALAQVFGWLRDAFVAEPAPFAAAWRERQPPAQSPAGFAHWRAVLQNQVVDLREMAEAGQLEDSQRYFGIDSPHGGRWYNFDPATYIECATAGSLGGWEPDDEGSRAFVPGVVAVLDDRGGIASARPEELERPVLELTALTWDDLTEFLQCGQWYE